MNKYIELLRINEWYKNITVIIGFIFALFLLNQPLTILNIGKVVIITFLSCLISSSNYIINAITDKDQDKTHPIKKQRPLPQKTININQAMFLMKILFIIPLLISILLFNIQTTISLLFLFIAAILYNLKPIRLKDIQYLDVILESINNPIRFSIGWFVLTNKFPPTSVLLLVWFAACFLMTKKRINEIKKYPKSRKVFKYYSINSLNITRIIYFLLTLITLIIFVLKWI